MKPLQKLTLLMSVLALLVAIPIAAQTGDGLTFQAPFAFYAGNTKLPPGNYKVTQADDNADLLLVESVDGVHSVFLDYVADQSPTIPSQTEVAFNKYGHKDFLSRVSIAGGTSKLIVASKVEQNAASAAAAEKHTLSAKNVRLGASN